MVEYLPFVVLALSALIGFMVAGVVGFGGGIIIMPVLVWVIGPREAVPVISVIAFIAGVSRTALNWQNINWGVVFWSWVGAGTSFIDGFLGTVGPLRSPFFLTYGLSGGSYIGTAGMIVLITQLPKIAVFGNNGLLEVKYLALAGGLGAIGFVASYLGKLTIGNLSPKTFGVVVEVMLCVTGIIINETHPNWSAHGHQLIRDVLPTPESREVFTAETISHNRPG